MAKTHLGDTPVQLAGEFLSVGDEAPAFTLTGKDFGSVSMSDFAGKKILMSIYPSLDTGVCANSVRAFNQKAAGHDGVEVLCISADLPPAMGRFCAAEGIENVTTLSTYKSPEFGDAYGVRMLEGKLEGLNARAVLIIGTDGKVSYTELVPTIGQEPDYDAALAAL